MFTGLVEEIGTIKKISTNNDGKVFNISAEKILVGAKIGDSIAIDGCCLSIISFTDDEFTVQAVHETLHRTTLGTWIMGNYVNLERAIAATSRFGGHFVQGHIDCTGTITGIKQYQNSAEIKITIPNKYMEFIIEKGSITISGISLTVAKKNSDSITIALIPITLKDTSLSTKKSSDKVNIETDIIGKYIKNIINQNNYPDIETKMKNWGY